MRIYSFLTSSKRLLQLAGLLFTLSISYISEAQNDLSAKMSALLRDPVIQKSQIGISIRNTATGEIVYDYNGSKSFTPASNLKLLTTSAAINLLGSDYTFKTPLQYSGELINGNFKGMLKITGSGDPTMGSDKMPGNSSYTEMIRRWVSEIKKTGISTFSGKLIIDPLVYEYNPVPIDYTWGDIGNYYGAGSYGINLNENQYVITFKPGLNLGEPAEVMSMIPWDSSWTFLNHVYTGSASSGDKSVIFSSPYSPTIFAEGSIPMGNLFSVKGSLPDPAALLGILLIKEMQVQGINWNGQLVVLHDQNENFSSDKITWNTIYTEQSLPVSSIIKQTNTISNNLYAECLLKEFSTKKGVKPASTNTSINYLKKHLQSMGIDTSGMVIRDGSGMSPFNSISPNQLTLLLFKMSDKTVFVQSLPVAGRDGTVSHICKGTGEKVRLKSGTMNGTTCYSGYIKTDSGQVYSASFMINKHEAKNRTVQRALESAILAILHD